jgi:membrane-associated phospholipid phosphatase
VRRASAIRATAWSVVAIGVAAPLARKRVRAPAVVLQGAAFAAPLGLCVALRRSRTRDVAACCLQMWAYVAAYKSPHDDVDEQAARVRIDYPIVADCALGLGELPTVRLQRALARSGPDGPVWRALDAALVWTHWAWFMVPHGSVAFILARHRGRFPRAAAMTYAVFDVGVVFYWVLPTAPPWYAALSGASEGGRTPAVAPEVRRMMVEYGETFWGDGWGPLYSVFGGNPLAAMPSLHFATSVMATLLLLEVGILPGAVVCAYTLALGFALVYLGEHYVVDLLAGAALTGFVWRLAPRFAPLAGRVRRGVATLESMAHGVA